MMKISRVTTQKKNRKRYNIYIYNGKQEEYGFSVDEDILVQHNLRKGLEISKEKVAHLKKQDTVHQSYNQVINYLSYRMRTKQEIREYLLKKEVDIEHIEQIIEKLVNQKLLDDEEFANLFVQSRIRSSTKGPIFVKKELMNKGVAERYAHQALNKYTYEKQFEKALKIVEKRLQRKSKHSFRRQLEQAKGTLQRNGFTSEVISDIIAEFHESKDENAEWNALTHQGEKLLRRHRKKYAGYELHQKVKEGLYRQGFSISVINEYLSNNEVIE